MKDAMLMVRMSSQLRDQIRREAERRGLDASEWIRAVLAEAVGGSPLNPAVGARKPRRVKRERR